MSVESELDPESDLTNTDFLTRRQNRYRIVVAECLNDGPVTAKKECAGGIAGRADIGYIARSVAYNSIALEDGDYAGGIAGLLYGTAGACVAKCSLTGSKYVGGIVGNGYSASSPDEKPSLVFNCYTLVDIHDRPQFSGAVSGGGEGDYSENRFVPSGYAGLNRLSIQGQAEPVLFSVFSSLNTLPEESKHFTLRFVSEGETVKEIPFEYGASFGRSVFPEMPVKDGAYAVWDRTELTDLRFDTVVTAEYRRSETALKSDLCREDGRAVGYVIGQFQQGDALKVERIPVEQGDIESFRLNWRQAAMEQLRSVLSGEPDYSIPISVLEHAEFRFPEDGLERHTLRYLSPNGATENIRVYQKSGGRWVRLQPEIFGSYLRENAERPDRRSRGTLSKRGSCARSFTAGESCFSYCWLFLPLFCWGLRFFCSPAACRRESPVTAYFGISTGGRRTSTLRSESPRAMRNSASTVRFTVWLTGIP